MKTAGVAPDSDPASGVGYYVHLYGNYQPYGHAGCDIKCPEGTPVYAMAAGTVLWADWGTKLPGDESNAGYRQRWYLYKGFPGIVTVIQHQGWIGVYAHLSEARMNTGDEVLEGQQIGLSGGTGGVAPHLHVEALVDLSFKTGGGLIYGRTSPEPFFGSAALAPQGTITPQAAPEPEEDFMGGFIDKDQAEDIAKRAAELVLAALDGKVKIHPVQAESIVKATTTRTVEGVDALNTGKQIDRQQADDIARAAARYTEEAK
jgi:murein DD-endopeptidase MepM/ murein hydrolase activator NlpD